MKDFFASSSIPAGMKFPAGSEYDRFDNLSETSWYRDGALLRKLVRLMDLTPGLRVLDIGCGSGRLLAEFSKQPVEAVGIDISSVMLRRARTRIPHNRQISLVHGAYDLNPAHSTT
jgi:ubiquinone/menaquinone biosynthesis C-methylase UbiE